MPEVQFDYLQLSLGIPQNRPIKIIHIKHFKGKINLKFEIKYPNLR